MNALVGFRVALVSAFALVSVVRSPAADDPRTKLATGASDQWFQKYCEAETDRLAKNCLAEIKTLDDWKQKRDDYRRQLFEMLGLNPLPEKGDLKPVITHTAKHDGYSVENLHFQSRPGLYVTANFYLPADTSQPCPTILYLCGHGRVLKNGVDYGNKTHYQHHGEWFARHGYACLVLDTIQLGEIAGIHHGTYKFDMWWWNSYGYTPAGVEAWNCIRALDYLQTRKEVDAERIGATGRSGGGAYTWWISALDDRIKVAVPVAGITDLHNHVVDGCVEGHCDCMYMVNTYRWDYAQAAALVAPRPLLITNTDRDPIFPLDGVYRLYQQVKRIYKLHGAEEKLGLQISEGPHKDTQELQVAAFHWFDRYLKKAEPLIEVAAKPLLPVEELKVFEKLPADERVTKIQESFVELAAEASIPADDKMRALSLRNHLNSLRSRCFASWPMAEHETTPFDGVKRERPCHLAVKTALAVERAGLKLSAYDFLSQEHVPLRLYVVHRAGLEQPDLTVLNVLDEEGWKKFLATYRSGFAEELKDNTLPPADEKGYDDTKKMFASFKWVMAYIAPRGVGPTALSSNENKRRQQLRRLNLLGTTLDTLQTYDVRRAIQAVREVPTLKESPLWLQGERQAAGWALYASLFEPKIARLDLWSLPTTHRDGPHYLNVMRVLDIPKTVALAANDKKLRLYDTDPAKWEFPLAVAKQLQWPEKQIEFRPAPDKN